jgi:ribose transport system permease protein
MDNSSRRRALGIQPADFFLPAILAVLAIGLAVFQARFYNHLNLLNVTRNTAVLTLVGGAQAFVIISGGFDVSIGAVVAFTSVACAMVMASAAAGLGPDLAAVFGVPAGIGIGALVGLVTGLGVAILDVSPFMMTLGMTSVVLGLAFFLTSGSPIYGLPDAFINAAGRNFYYGLPATVWVAVLVLIVLVFVQRQTRFGRHLYAIGGNRDAARLSGVPTRRYLIYAYILSGALSGVVGVLLTARLGSGQANLGSELTMQSIAVAVIAGINLRGGVGKVERVVLSAIFVAVVANAMNLLRIDSKIQTIVLGIALLLAVAIDQNWRGSKHAG